MGIENLKQQTAEAAVELVRDGMILGLGTGSTTRYAIEAVGRRVADGLEVVGIPTSKATAALAQTQGIPLTTLEEHPQVDLTIDGADEVDPHLNLIKGMGGALFREKLVALASERMVVIVDEGKLVEVLGRRTPVPVEVLSFGHLRTAQALAALGAEPVLRSGEEGPFVTDNGHYILDCRFPEIRDPTALAIQMKTLPGVLEHGLFLGLADAVLVGTPEGVMTRRRPSPPAEGGASAPPEP